MAASRGCSKDVLSSMDPGFRWLEHVEAAKRPRVEYTRWETLGFGTRLRGELVSIQSRMRKSCSKVGPSNFSAPPGAAWNVANFENFCNDNDAE